MDQFFETITPWLWQTAVSLGLASLSVILILLAGYVAMRFVRTAIKHLEAFLIQTGERTEPVPGSTRKRVTTLVGLLQTVATTVIWAVVIIISLAQMGLNIAPILAGAGIVGLAVGFGAQNLVRDVISGFFFIMENHIRVGDVVVANGTGGLVESMTYRILVLRDLAGTVHVFPYGTITSLSNMTKEWSAYLMDIGVAYKEDTDRVVEVMQQVAEELRQDPEYGPKILESLEVFGVDAFGDSAVVIKARLKTLPIEQWMVGREYRRRLKKAFDAHGIEIPFPHRSIYVGSATAPLNVHLQHAATETVETPQGEESQR